ncbi:integration host factor subunit beta [Treponema zuelzerae]|uniref:Integration host factor subunit beta n=1 Tax=Teretinema zuelzerae TaxID=156 RepID=A0AAE3EG60_9SPIR|nr:HU family DNA-binding protein [Teretinema zuelzerae]MBN2810663.1 integration host factor subunit beta [Spirochaetales bacterium]MCD1653208.1 integration host factor subunit beta [Teretinema zuelzerae]
MNSGKQTKSELIENIYQKSGHELKDIRGIVDLFLEEIKSALENDQCVELRGFGTFEIRERKGRKKARNPKTGEIVSVEDHAVVAFRSGKDLKNTVWDIPSRRSADGASRDTK